MFWTVKNKVTKQDVTLQCTDTWLLKTQNRGRRPVHGVLRSASTATSGDRLAPTTAVQGRPRDHGSGGVARHGGSGGMGEGEGGSASTRDGGEESRWLGSEEEQGERTG